MLNRKVLLGMFIGLVLGFINPFGLVPANAQVRSISGYVHYTGNYPTNPDMLRNAAWKEYRKYLGNCREDFDNNFFGVVSVSELPKNLKVRDKAIEYDFGKVYGTLYPSKIKGIVYVLGPYNGECNGEL